MLVLTRRKGQSIKIDDEIEITILKITGSTVRLGVTAPDGVKILRAELEDGDDNQEERKVA